MIGNRPDMPEDLSECEVKEYSDGSTARLFHRESGWISMGMTVEEAYRLVSGEPD